MSRKARLLAPATTIAAFDWSGGTARPVEVAPAAPVAPPPMAAPPAAAARAKAAETVPVREPSISRRASRCQGAVARPISPIVTIAASIALRSIGLRP